MSVDRSLLWLLLAITCAPATAIALRHRLRTGFYRTHRRCADAPLAFAAVLGDAVLTGLGAGMAMTLGVVVVGAGLAVAGL